MKLPYMSMEFTEAITHAINWNEQNNSMKGDIDIQRPPNTSAKIASRARFY